METEYITTAGQVQVHFSMSWVMAGHETESKAGMHKNGASAKILCCLHRGIDPLSLAFSLSYLGDLDSLIFLEYGQPQHLINRTAYRKFDLCRAPEKQNHRKKNGCVQHLRQV